MVSLLRSQVVSLIGLRTPIVRQSNSRAIYDTYKELKRLEADINKQLGLELILIINEQFNEVLNELKEFASTYKPELNSSVMRLFQIEGKLNKHL